MEFLRRGQLVGRKVELRSDGELIHRYWQSGVVRPERLWRAPWRWILRGRQRRVTRYPPYYEMVPSLADPSVLVAVKPPIIVNEHGDAPTHRYVDLTAYESVREVEGYVEAYDVLNDEYTVYDSDGRLLQATVPGGKVTDPVRILCVDFEPRHAAELRSLLVHSLANTGVSEEWLSEPPLELLTARALEYKSWS